ncbi:hypothetical protein ACLFMI_06035 [Pseudonocardia nantongensis]|uniref:hypothetical protein n=1 Tax=Pseudonocardia nantongensis TaxID=1181885 RepID=UPI00397B0166
MTSWPGTWSDSCTTPHRTRGKGFARLRSGQLAELIEEAWRRTAPVTVVRRHEG